MNIFKPGTYFTGCNREIYPRSLYQYMGYNEETGKHDVKFYCLAAWKEEPPMELKWPTDTFYEWKNRHTRLGLWYREATSDEVEKYKGNSYCEPPEFYGLDAKFRSRRQA